MVTKKEVDKFIKSQRTFTANGPEYKKTKEVLKDVLLSMTKQEFKKATKNLVLTVLHEGPFGQLMHMKPVRGEYKIMQLTVPKDMPITVLRYIIAHELGHAIQGRNWRKGDENRLEKDADRWAEKWGFPKTKTIESYMERYRKRISYRRRWK